MSTSRKDAEHYFAASPKSQQRFGVIKACLRGRPFEFLSSSSVFSKTKVDLGTRVLIESMILPQQGCILDIGCGYGAVGIAASAFNRQLKVVMTDVNIRAVRLAAKNIEANKARNAEVRYGFLYEPVEGLMFDCVLSNPPVSAGMETVRAIVEQAPKVMTKDATLQMVIRSKIGAKSLPALFTEVFGDCQIVARESGYRVLLGTKKNGIT